MTPGRAKWFTFHQQRMRTVKEEYISLIEYKDFADALAQLGHFMEEVC